MDVLHKLCSCECKKQRYHCPSTSPSSWTHEHFQINPTEVHNVQSHSPSWMFHAEKQTAEETDLSRALSEKAAAGCLCPPRDAREGIEREKHPNPHMHSAHSLSPTRHHRIQSEDTVQ